MTVRGEDLSVDLLGAIVRYYPGEDDADEAVRARKREMVEAGAAIVRVMPRPPKSKLPLPPTAGKRAPLREVVLEAARARKLDGLEGAVLSVMAEVGI